MMNIKTQGRVVAATLAAALALTAVDMRPVAAATASPHKADAVKTQASDATEFSSQRRHYRSNRGNAAAAAAIIGTFGAVAGIAAAERSRRNYYRNDGYYDYGYAQPSYGYYAPQPYYGSGYYGARREYFPN